MADVIITNNVLVDTKTDDAWLQRLLSHIYSA